MNPHYHGYTDIPSPHSPPPDNGNYGHMPITNGHMGLVHHHTSPYLHHLNNANNNNTNSSSNNNNNNSCGGGGGGGPGPGPAAKMCGGCGGKIVERFLLHALDRYWHTGCLKCSCCGAMLADIGSSCFFKANMILCKNDYARLFGNTGTCSACGQTIPASEFVMRAGAAGGPGTPQQHHVFHLKCFACSKCGAQLVPGDRYYFLAGSLVCEQDWHKLLKAAPVGQPPTPPVRKGKVGRPRRSRD